VGEAFRAAAPDAGSSSSGSVAVVSTMMPEAFELGGPLTGVVTTFGFAVSFALTVLD
jgi:hypothetical protein